MARDTLPRLLCVLVMDTDPATSDEPIAESAPGLVGPEYLDILLSHLTETVLIFDRNGDLKARLSAPSGMLGHSAGAGVNIFTYLHPDDIPRSLAIRDEVQQAIPGWSSGFTVRLRHADGSWRRFQVLLTNRYDDPSVEGMVVQARELVETMANGIEEQSIGSVADNLPTAYLALGEAGTILFASLAATELLNAGRDQLVGMALTAMVVDHDRPALAAAYEALLRTPGSRSVVISTRRLFGGRTLAVELHTRGAANYKVVTAVLLDHSAEPELVRLATRDHLTGLANRAKVLETITGLLLDPEPDVAVIFVDLDGLKSINDNHGHESGDRALVAVAQRLESIIRPKDMVGRLSGDEFAVICPGLSGDALSGLVQRIEEKAPPDQVIITATGAELAITVSAGGAIAVPGDTTSSLLARADQAMFGSKRAGWVESRHEPSGSSRNRTS